MEGVAGREGPSVRISSNGGDGGRQRDPSARVSSHREAGGRQRDLFTRVLSHRGGKSRWKLQVVSYCSM